MSALLEAIAKTAGEIQPLAKNQFNPHAKYAYVGIDDFYREVAPIARANGLIWFASETAPPDILDGDKHPILVFHFGVVLIHVSGLQIVMKISVPHGWQGAQTAGSASSYAVKTVLRAVFAVQTGEADADSAATDFAPRSPSGAKSDPFAVTAATVAVPPDVSPTSVPPAPHILPGAAGGRDSSIYVMLEELEPICKGLTD